MLVRTQSNEVADPGVGQRSGRVGDLRHLIQEPRLAFERSGGGWRGRPGGRFDLGFFLGLDLLFGEGGTVVVVIDAFGEEPGCCRFRLRPRWLGLCLVPVLFDRPAVHAERAGKRLDRGEQALLEAGDQQGGGRLLFLGLSRQAGFPQFPVLVEQL